MTRHAAQRVHPGRALLQAAAACAIGTPALAQDSHGLAMKLSNPVAAMTSVPFQYNYDRNFGSERSGHRSLLNIQPVVPFTLDERWNLISRTILPVISQDGVIPGTDQSGIGDITQSLFLSPSEPGPGGLIWGAGPVLLLPTGSDRSLSARRWGLGPTGVVLRQQGSWTYGALANHVWSVGSSDRPAISNTFVQPFVAYATPAGWTFAMNSESTYDWKATQWSVPVNLTVSKLLTVGPQALSLGGGLRYWVEGPEAGPHQLGFRLFVTFLFPK